MSRPQLDNTTLPTCRREPLFPLSLLNGALQPVTSHADPTVRPHVLCAPASTGPRTLISLSSPFPFLLRQAALTVPCVISTPSIFTPCPQRLADQIWGCAPARTHLASLTGPST